MTKTVTKSIDPIVTTTSKPVDSLKIIPLPTADGMDEDSVNDHLNEYDAFATMDDTSVMYQQLSAYGASYKTWLAPKGWKGGGEVGADGSIAVRLFPANSDSLRSIHISYSVIPACQGCIMSAAAPFFPAALKLYNESFNDDHTDTTTGKQPAGIVIKRISAQLVTYTLPDQNGLQTRGVVYYESGENGTDPYYADAIFVLPKEQAAIAEFLQKNFVAKYTAP